MKPNLVKHNLNSHEFGHLQHLYDAGLLRKVMPDEVAGRLLEHGYIRHGVGGHVITDEGMDVLFGGKDA